MAFVNGVALGPSVFAPSLTGRQEKCKSTSIKRTKTSLHITYPRMGVSRRDVLRQLSLTASSAALGIISNAILTGKKGVQIHAAMYSADTTASFPTGSGDPNKLSTHMPQIEAGYKTLLSLRDNWEQKTSTYDGDVVRRDLGTVGLKSPLFNIRKTLFKAFQVIANSSEDDELVERLETEWNDVVSGISSVDFQLYSVSFTELRESKDSLIKQGRVALDDLINVYADMLKDFNSVS